MRTLDRKLLRDLWGMKGQALAIILVISSGVATLVMSLTVLGSLKNTLRVYYGDYRFADVFASLERAPEGVAARVRDIEGVRSVETRVVAFVNLEVEGFGQPASGKLLSLPEGHAPLMNGVLLKAGRLVEPGGNDEVVLSEAFAEAHGYRVGSRLEVVMNGRHRRLEVVGLGMSPEYIYQIGPGAMMPDFETFAILWMGRDRLGGAYDLDGAFNDLALELEPDANLADVLDRLDQLLEPYGGLGAYSRADQLSNRFLREEFRQLTTMATLFPTIFLGVAAFLLNVVVARLVNTQREQIAALKAFGYSNTAVGVHYLKMILVITALGVVVGIFEGRWLGMGLGAMYMGIYRFPYLLYELRAEVVVIAAIVSGVAAIGGTLWAVRRAARLPPAEAMRPEPPATYRETVVERLGLKRFLAQPSRMIIRHLERRPGKTALAILGLAFSYAVLMVGTFFEDAVDAMIEVQFGLTQRDDLSVSFVQPTSRRALYELQSLDGVERGEPYRAVPVRFRSGHHSYRSNLQGFEAEGELFRLLDDRLRPVELPPEGVLLTDHLGTILDIRAGDQVTIEVLEGARPTLQVPVAGLIKQYIGVGGYMQLDALNRVLRQGDAISGVHLVADPARQSDIYAALNDLPRVAGTVVRANARRQARKTIGEQMLTFAFFTTILAATIAFGVVYNSARIALSERERELASLRVLGLTRGEISYILLGELAVLTLAAVPVGFALGYGMCHFMVSRLQNDLFRIPMVIEPGTFAFAATVVLVAALLSGLIVRRRLDHLDLVAVLKTRE